MLDILGPLSRYDAFSCRPAAPLVLPQAPLKAPRGTLTGGKSLPRAHSVGSSGSSRPRRRAPCSSRLMAVLKAACRDAVSMSRHKR